MGISEVPPQGLVNSFEFAKKYKSSCCKKYKKGKRCKRCPGRAKMKNCHINFSMSMSASLAG